MSYKKGLMKIKNVETGVVYFGCNVEHNVHDFWLERDGNAKKDSKRGPAIIRVDDRKKLPDNFILLSISFGD